VRTIGIPAPAAKRAFDRQKEQLESGITWGFVIPGNGIVVKCGYAVLERNASKGRIPGAILSGNSRCMCRNSYRRKAQSMDWI